MRPHEEIDAARVRFREVDRDHWLDLVRLFESPGGPRHCWCMVWRDRPGAYRAEERARAEWAKAALAERVAAGVPIGILGYHGSQPVAWCSVAPRSSYRPLGGIDEPGADAERVWSIVCFFVVRRARGMGIMQRTLEAAVDFARARGATALEAYPVDADSPSYRFMGFVPAFARAGFHEAGRAGTRRHVMRLHL